MKTPGSIRLSTRFFLLALLASLTAPQISRAGLHVWTGAASGYWSNTNNWQNGSAPQFLETPPVVLDFAAGATRLSTTNDIATPLVGLDIGLAVDAFLVSGNNYTFYGVGSGTNIALTGNPVSIFGVNYQNLYCPGTNLTFDSSLTLTLVNTNTITNSPGSLLTMQASLIGAGGWTFQGLGTMIFSGSNLNTFAGTCEVDGGLVVLQRACTDVPSFSISGPLIIGTTNPAVPAVVSEYETADQFGMYGVDDNYGDTGFIGYPPITIAPSGTFQIIGGAISSGFPGLELQYLPETIGSLTMTGGVVSLLGANQTNANRVGGMGTNFPQFYIVGTLTIEPYASPSVITGHGLGTSDTDPADSMFYNNSAVLCDYLTNINVPANAELMMDTPLGTGSSALPPGLYPLVKQGTGTVWQSGTNRSFYGAIFVEEGVWVATGDLPFGANSLYDFYTPFQNETTVFPGAEVVIANTCSNGVPIILNGFGFLGASAALVVEAGGVQNTAGCTIGSDTAINVAGANDSVSFDNYQTFGTASFAGTNSFQKLGSGTMTISNSANSDYEFLSGSCLVDEGTLVLAGQTNNALLSGPVTIGADSTLLLEAPEQIYTNCPVEVDDGGILNCNNQAQTIASLALNGGSVYYGNPLTLAGDVTAQSGVNNAEIFLGSLDIDAGTQGFGTPAPRNFNVISGKLTITAAINDGGYFYGITKEGAGELDLIGPGTYGGATSVSAGELSIYNNTALGTGTGGVTVAAGAQLAINNGINVSNLPLYLSGSGMSGTGALIGSGTNSWTGPVILTNATTIYAYSNSQLELSGVVSGGTGLTKAGPGILLLDGNHANTYGGTTTVQQGNLYLNKADTVAVPGALVIGNNVDAPNSEKVYLMQAVQLGVNPPLTINASGLLNAPAGFDNNVGALSGSGALQLDGGLGVNNDNSTTVFSGALSGAGIFYKQGSGALTLTSTNSFSGVCVISSGQLYVRSMGSANMTVSPGALLGGTGTVGDLTSLGTVSPGYNSPGILNCGYLQLVSSSTFKASLNGTTPGNYSQLHVLNTAGGIAISGGLQVTMGFAGAVSNQYVIIKNSSGGPVQGGGFAGLPEGATLVTSNGTHFTISYVGGGGNDVVLTQTSAVPPPVVDGIRSLAGGSMQIIGSGISNTSYTVWANTNLSQTNWTLIGTVTSPGTNLLFIDTNANQYQQRFYRLSE